MRWLLASAAVMAMLPAPALAAPSPVAVAGSGVEVVAPESPDPAVPLPVIGEGVRVIVASTVVPGVRPYAEVKWSVVSYPKVAAGLTCGGLLLSRAPGTSADLTLDFPYAQSCTQSSDLFAAGPMRLHWGFLNFMAPSKGEWAWGYAAPEVTSIHVVLASGDTVRVPIVDHTFLYVASYSARPFSQPQSIVAMGAGGKRLEWVSIL